MTVQEMHESNRAAWNEGASHYAREEEIQRMVAFLRDGGANFDPPELPFVNTLGGWCGRAIHLQCAGGTDTLSLWNKGAKEVIGVDISDRMIEVARRKTELLNAPATWYRCDVLETPHELDGTADLVYTGRGALCWLQDIQAWAKVVARLLKPGGRLFVYEGHPLTWVWDMEADHFRLDPVYGDYFMKQPVGEQGWPNQYIGDIGIPTEQQAKKYERQKTLADIVNAIIGADLRIAELGEHPDEYWDQFPNIPEDIRRRLPQTFTLLAMRPLTGA